MLFAIIPESLVVLRPGGSHVSPVAVSVHLSLEAERLCPAVAVYYASFDSLLHLPHSIRENYVCFESLSIGSSPTSLLFKICRGSRPQPAAKPSRASARRCSACHQFLGLDQCQQRHRSGRRLSSPQGRSQSLARGVLYEDDFEAV